jgi:hypothetical protein
VGDHFYTYPVVTELRPEATVSSVSPNEAAGPRRHPSSSSGGVEPAPPPTTTPQVELATW